MARALNLGAYLKGDEGVTRIEEQKCFVARGQVWQGYKGAVYRSHEDQLSNEELLAIDDLDETKHEVWKRRNERLAARGSQKSEEYDHRRALLRKDRNDLYQSVKNSKEMGLPPSPSDLRDISKIEERMERLVVLSQSEEFYPPEETAEVAPVEAEPEPVPQPTVDREKYKCKECGEMPPADYTKDPRRWVTGHKMGRHKKQRAS